MSRFWRSTPSEKGRICWNHQDSTRSIAPLEEIAWLVYQAPQRINHRCFDELAVLWLREVDAGESFAESGDEVRLVGNLGLDIVGEVVGVVARKYRAARHGRLAASGIHLLDIVLVVGVDDGGDIEVGHAAPSAKVDLTKHTRSIFLALLDSVIVTDPLVREVDNSLLLVVAGDRGDLGETRVRGEVDGADEVIEGPEGDTGGAGGSCGGNESQSRGSETHFGFFEFALFACSCVCKDCSLSRELASEMYCSRD